MEIRDRVTFFLSSAECSTGTADGGNTFCTKRTKTHPPCKAATLIRCFHLMRKVLIQRLALLQCQSQVRIAREYRSYIRRKKAKEGLYPVTIYLNCSYSEKADVVIYGNFSSPPWTV